MIVEWTFVWGILSCVAGPVIGGFMRFGLGDGRSAEPAPARFAQDLKLSTYVRRAAARVRAISKKRH